MKKRLPVLKAFLLSVAILLVTPQGFAQHLTSSEGISSYAALDKQVAPKSHRGQLLVDVLGEIESRYDVNFHYNHELVNGRFIVDIVTFDTKKDKIEDILQRILTPINLTFQKVGKKIYLIKKEDKELQSSNVLPMGDRKTLPASEKDVPAQEFTVSGIVTDEDGATIPGVNVIVKGTTIGTVTDVDGNYTLSVPSSEGTLVFSYIGFTAQEVEIGGRASINVTLASDTQTLDEIVVVGYGTQKEVNVTGSISTVNSKELAKVSMPTLTQGLMGRAAGVFIKNESGQPGENKTRFNIRGFGEPLIIVDGNPVSSAYFAQLNPNDIANFSVLKDAAAASIYGSRAGNGVILVTTNRGVDSAPQISYTLDFAQQFFTNIPRFASSAEYLEIKNYIEWSEGRDPIYTQEEIDLYRSGADPVKYPNNQMWDIVFHKYAPQLNHNFNIRGGTEKVKYFVSAGWLDQSGMLKANTMNYDRYSFRSNLDVSLTDKLSVGTLFSVIHEDYLGPRQEMTGAPGEQGMVQRVYRQRPFFERFTLPDPTLVPAYGSGASDDPYYFTIHELYGYRKNITQNATFNFTLKYDLPFGLQARANYYLATRLFDYKRKTLEGKAYDYDTETDTYIFRKQSFPYNMLEERRDRSNDFNQQYFLTWDKNFAQHNFSVLLGHEILSENYNRIEASRLRYEFDIDYLFAGPDLDKDNNGIASEGGRKAYFGRINYDYDGKYMVEFNSRWDASPNFPPDTRWGFFPSVALGWRISEEAFMDDASFLSNLKIRASHGNLGYDRAGQFQYLATYSLSGRYIYEDQLQSGLIADALPNPYITWEKMTTSNVGLDFALWDGALDGSVDYFYRKRTDVLGTRILELPDVVGALLPEENYREFDNRGWELALNHAHKIADVNYSIGGNISWNREKALVVDQTPFGTMEGYRTGNQAGEWTDRFWMYPHDGLFKTQEEIDNYGVNIDGRSNARIQPGDIKYVDYNGDGRITSEDRILGGRGNMPRLSYGINMSASWKGFDFFMLWQGAGLYNVNLSNNGYYPRILQGNAAPLHHHYYQTYMPEGNPWVPANTEGPFPRYRSTATTNAHPNRQFVTDHWFLDASYIRLKNIQLGYTLPKSLTERIAMDNVRVYIGGYNILTLTKMRFLDPEVDTAPPLGGNSVGITHPQLGTYNMGIEIKF